MRISDFRRLALSMPHAVERAHMRHPDFRVRNRIFATLYRQELGLAMIKLKPEQQKRVVRDHPRIFAPITGGWGRQGATEVRLAAASSAVVRRTLLTAWRNAAPASLANDSILVDRPMFFESPAEFRAWLKNNHRRTSEVLVGFHKRHTERPTMTWRQSVAEALCFGWIDGIRKRLDEDRYTIRFTPRRKGSKWSAINIRMIAELEAAGRMTAAGREAFEARPHQTGEGPRGTPTSAAFDRTRLAGFKRDPHAWAFFQAQPPGYRRLMTWWVMSAKRETTRDNRLARLQKASASHKRLT